MKLTKKQEAFCREYVVDYNAKQAAIRAGYSEKTAHVTAHENLNKPNVVNFLQKLQDKQKEKIEISAAELTAFFRDMVNDKNQKGADRIRAAENLARRVGYFEEDNKQKQPPSPPQIIIGD